MSWPRWKKYFLSTIHLFSQSISFQLDRSSELDNATKTLRLSAETFFAQTFLAFHPGFLLYNRENWRIFLFEREEWEQCNLSCGPARLSMASHLTRGNHSNHQYLHHHCYQRHVLRLGDCLTTKATGSGCHQVKYISIISIKMFNSLKKYEDDVGHVGQCDDCSADKIVLEFDYKGCRIGLPPTKLIGILETERILIWWEQWLKWQFREPVLQRCKIYPIERTYFWIFWALGNRMAWLQNHQRFLSKVRSR